MSISLAITREYATNYKTDSLIDDVKCNRNASSNISFESSRFTFTALLHVFQC